MNADAIGGTTDFPGIEHELPPVAEDRPVNLTAVIAQLDRIEGRLSRVEGAGFAQAEKMEAVAAFNADIKRNLEWIVAQVSALMQLAETLPGVGGMAQKMMGRGRG